MAQVFHFTKDQAGLHSSFGELQRRLKDASKQKGIESSIANALWSQEGHAFVPGFLYLDEEDPRLTAAEIAALFSLAHNAQGMELLRKSSYGALFVGSEPYRVSAHPENPAPDPIITFLAGRSSQGSPLAWM